MLISDGELSDGASLLDVRWELGGPPGRDLYLEGAEVDYVESLEGAGFKFNNPHVKSTCGCGSSFQV